MLLVSGVVERLFSRVDTNNAGTPNTCKRRQRSMAWNDKMTKKSYLVLAGTHEQSTHPPTHTHPATV